MRISDWSSDVCSSDLAAQTGLQQRRSTFETPSLERLYYWLEWRADLRRQYRPSSRGVGPLRGRQDRRALRGHPTSLWIRTRYDAARSEEQTAELQSLMRTSDAGLRLKKTKQHIPNTTRRV